MLYAFAVFGLFLVVAPWTPVWNRAMLVLLPTSIGTWAMSGWARGVVSGLGALDLLVALQVAREFWGQMQSEN
jgi:hypothetical protein